jgi:hypothetical protein
MARHGPKVKRIVAIANPGCIGQGKTDTVALLIITSLKGHLVRKSFRKKTPFGIVSAQ